jgi:hypothetical protein
MIDSHTNCSWDQENKNIRDEKTVKGMGPFKEKQYLYPFFLKSISRIRALVKVRVVQKKGTVVDYK